MLSILTKKYPLVRRRLISTLWRSYHATNSINDSNRKLKGYEFYEKVLGSPKYILAPMVEQSELAWRLLCRRYGVQLCYTPMFHARLFTDPGCGEKYRFEQWSTSLMDRPLIVQFCANDVDHFLKAAKMVENQCDAIDLNLGCPQAIAKKGHYGSYLQDDWDLINKLISTADKELNIPITAKIRVFKDVSKTIDYAKMIIKSGAQLLTVHGRCREQKGHHTGLADWSIIKAVRDAIPDTPIIANGNILYHEDIQRCLDATGADGVMSAEGALFNPAIFQKERNMPPLAYEIALEYLNICKSVQPTTRAEVVRAHLFRLLHASLKQNENLRPLLDGCNSLDMMEQIVCELKIRMERERLQCTELPVKGDIHQIRDYAPWRCQPRFRPKLSVDHEELRNKERRQKALAALAALKAEREHLDVNKSRQAARP
ncbi:dihydrouridine synthase-domain-containing protein [Mycotypha africana]|uniref:dihydrouridine synthase-domain-containing protein n=1 Tax=Mycotypha africana TaxID=64632 RepID=UPI0022FFD3CA|nr:dihydrouridine synthase-domain-containing protein [Mycotypha africana]KAI8969014.1 dihydrouridine synthase-domain-containing protein [Mycotypha africana]